MDAQHDAGFAIAILDAIERETMRYMALLRANASDDRLEESHHALAVLNRAYDAYTYEDR